MQVEITHDDGELAFVSPIQLKPKHLRLTIEIPDEDIVAPSTVSEGLKNLESKYKLLPEVMKLAQEAEAKLDRVRNAPLPADEELPPLSPKTLDRVKAFELREDR